MTTEANTELRDRNRQILVESIQQFVKWDHSKPDAASGGYAGGRYPDLWTDDAIFETPFSPDGWINRRVGRAALEIEAQMRYNLFSHYAWKEPFEVHDMLDPNKFLLFTEGKGESKEGTKYHNKYVFFVTMRDGKIYHMRQYFDGGNLAPIYQETIAAEPETA